MRARKWCQYLRHNDWEPVLLTGPFHNDTRCLPVEGVRVVGRAADGPSRPVPPWKIWRQCVQGFLVPDPYVVRWLPWGIRQGQAILQQETFDAIVSTSPLDTCHLIGLNLMRRFKKPWIADFRDPWVNNPSAPPRPVWLMH